MRHSVLLSCLLLAIAVVWGCSAGAPLPPKAVALNQAGVQALSGGDLELAAARFDLALEYNPRFVEALTNRGLVELERGNFPRAQQLIERARRINPHVAQPHHGLGVLAEREGRLDDASTHYRDALAIDPGFSSARYNLARLLFDAGKLLHAKVEFEKLIETAPESPAARVGLAETLLGLGRSEEAEALVRVSRERFPGSAGLVILEARAYLRRGETTRAVLILTPLSEGSDEVAVQALAWLAVAELARDRPRKALSAAEEALHLDPAAEVARFAYESVLSRLQKARKPEGEALDSDR